MASLMAEALAYEPKKTKNISDLPTVPISAEIVKKNGTRKNGEAFSYLAIEIAGEEYRVPYSVLSSLKQILIEKPDTKAFKVRSSGMGKETTYTVIPL